MTGVEAVSNGVEALREPRVPSKLTLAIIVACLAAMLGGITWLARDLHLVALDQRRLGYRSVLEQLAAAVFGEGVW